MAMDEQEHKQRHVELHKMLDELTADFISHTSGRISDTILDLIEWSHQQTISPSVKEPELRLEVAE